MNFGLTLRSFPSARFLDRYRTAGNIPWNNHGFFFEAVSWVFFYHNVSNSGFQETPYKPGPPMLSRYIHHVRNKEHRNLYCFWIPPDHRQTPECRRLPFPGLHEHRRQ